MDEWVKHILLSPWRLLLVSCRVNSDLFQPQLNVHHVHNLSYGINIVISTLFFTKLLSSLSASKQQVNVNANVGYLSLVIVALTIASPQIALKTLLVNNNAS